MNDDERRRLGEAEAHIRRVREVLPDLVTSVQDLAAQAGTQTAEAAAARRDLDRLHTAVHENYAGGPGIGPRTIAMDNNDSGNSATSGLLGLGKLIEATKERNPFALLVVAVALLMMMIGLVGVILAATGTLADVINALTGR